MKKCSWTLIIACILLFENQPYAQWVQTDCPGGGYVDCFAVSGNRIFAVMGNCSVFLSIDNGISWTAVSHLPIRYFESVHSLAVNGDTIIAGTTEGLFLSIDDGAHWSTVNSGPAHAIRSLAASGGTIFAGTDSGVYRSFDYGASWTAVDSGPVNVRSLAVSGITLFAGTHEPGVDGIYFSTNNGISWTALADFDVPADPDDWSGVHSLAVSDDNLFVVNDSGCLFRSTDHGTSWNIIDYGLPDSSVTCLAANGSSIFTGTRRSGVFRSIDNGTSWTAVNCTFTKIPIQLLPVSNGTIFAGTYDGVYRCSDNGASWTAATSGLPSTCVQGFAMSDGVIYAAAGDFFNDEGGIFRSTDDGASWTIVDSIPWWYGPDDQDFRPRLVSLAANGGDIFAGFNDIFGDYGIGDNGVVLLYTDNGDSWIADTTATPLNTGIMSLAVVDNTILAGTGRKGVYRSTDNGSTWTAVNSGLPDTSYVYTFAAGRGSIFAGTDRGVFLSTDNGTSWTAANSGLTAIVTSLTVSGDNIFAGTSDMRMPPAAIEPVRAFTAALTGYRPQYTETFDSGGVFLTTDNGATWTAVTTGLPNTGIWSLAVSENTLFAGTSRYGLWRRPLSEMAGSTNVHPRQEIINQAHFKISVLNRGGSALSVEFNIPHPDRVTVKMYDLAGREIASLVNQRHNAGLYRYFWDTHSLARGCFMLKMQAGATTFTKLVRIMN